jgi:hypothetical protein
VKQILLKEILLVSARTGNDSKEKGKFLMLVGATTVYDSKEKRIFRCVGGCQNCLRH